MGEIAKIALSPIGALLGVFDKPDAPKQPLTPPPAQPTRTSAIRDELSARQGARSNQRSGSLGAEASTGTKSKLGT